MNVTAELPIKVTNPNNGSHGRWWHVAAERKRQRALVALWFHSAEARALRGRIPSAVTFTRLAPSAGLDSDALPASCKAIRDEIAKQFGVTDGPTGPIAWHYLQARSEAKGIYAVRVEFEVSA